MPEPSTHPLPEPLEAIERELKLRKDVEEAHAIFHMKPSARSADRLEHALEAWQANDSKERR